MSHLERRLPEDPLEFIRECVRQGRVLWTYHVWMRLRSRSISREAILSATDAYEIVESYPQAKYLPSWEPDLRTRRRR